MLIGIKGLFTILCLEEDCCYKNRVPMNYSNAEKIADNHVINTGHTVSLVPYVIYNKPEQINGREI